jgi:hypothetical protein
LVGGGFGFAQFDHDLEILELLFRFQQRFDLAAEGIGFVDRLLGLFAIVPEGFSCHQSVQLAQTLIQGDLVDEFRFMIDPLAVGGGKRLFPEDGGMRRLELVDGQVTGSGAILATYVPAQD